MKQLMEWVKSFAFAVVAVLIIRSFIGLPYMVSGESMEPNFHDGDRLIVNRLAYHLTEPKRSDVIVLHANELGKDLIKRVIALPGDRVSVFEDKVCINNVCDPEPYLHQVVESARITGDAWNVINYDETTVPSGHVFVLGDNRSNSSDSRTPEIGMIPFDDIVGRVDLTFWSKRWIGY